jgi:hypothetical protein
MRIGVAPTEQYTHHSKLLWDVSSGPELLGFPGVNHGFRNAG